MDKSQIIERLLKIKALSEQGSAGEKENARKLLEELMEKYGISADELNSDEVGYHLYFIGNGDFDFKLFTQILYHMYEGKTVPKTADLRKTPKKYIKEWSQIGLGPANSNVGVKCTKAEFIELVTTFEIYKRDLEKQADNFLYAYFKTNDLLVSRDKNSKPPTEEEIEQAMAASLMSMGIKRKEIHKLIEE